MSRLPALVGLAALLGSCGPSTRPATEEPDLELNVSAPWVDPAEDLPYPAEALPDLARAVENADAKPIVIEHATILTAAGDRIDDGTLILVGGAIRYVGAGGVEHPADAEVIDATGRTVTPGLIDTHSHIGVYAQPGVNAHDDGNEMTAPVTAGVRAEYGYWPQDPAITRAVAGGVTTAQILPGSANLVGGRGFTVVMRPGIEKEDVRFPGAPATLKMACGENPKSVYGEKGGPATRMGIYAAFRAAFYEAVEYEATRVAYQRDLAVWKTKKERAAELEVAAQRRGKFGSVKSEPAPVPPPRDAKLETLAAALRGEVLVQIHCYRAGEMAEMIAIADEVGLKIRSFHHAIEAYKIRNLLAERGIAINTWADWWGFKMESFDGIPENAALLTEAGGRSVIHSDSSIGIQRLNQEAAKAMYAGRRAGINITDDQALRWITANAAWVLGIDGITGTLQKGKRADVVIWNGSPFSSAARADLVIEAGEVVYDRQAGREPTDFELGNGFVTEGATP